MDAKTKIRLLSDYQAALDNADLRNNIELMPSGEYLYEIITAAINTQITELLEGERAVSASKLNQAEAELGKLVGTIQGLNASGVVKILEGIKNRLEAPSQPTEAYQPQYPDGTASIDSRLEIPGRSHPSAIAVHPPMRRGGGGFG